MGDEHRVVRRVEPLARRGRTCGRAWPWPSLEPIEVGLGVAAERQALGEDVRAAAEAAEPLDAAHEVGSDAALRALQLRGGALRRGTPPPPRRSAFSTAAGSTPGFTVAWMSKVPAISAPRPDTVVTSSFS